ncbi:methyltransferase domain-containing protein [candidate division KSB1 bacterium]|nr:methyltransferase domain-containing protein [candidate division KSB1 bacterium]
MDNLRNTTLGADNVTVSYRCRFCNSQNVHSMIDLGMSPLCENYLSANQLNDMEPFYPLHVYVCQDCFLVQLEQFVPREEIFSEYAYFSSYASSWVQHARDYTEMVIERFGLTAAHFVVELASNDGYLLQHFVKRGIPVLGIEPAANVAQAAIDKGIWTKIMFFDDLSVEELLGDGSKPDLLIGNNVLAQVPDLNSFVRGMKLYLKDGGVITMEFPHLLNLMEKNQFDTIYHEHFSYFSLIAVDKIFAGHGLQIFDVEEIPTHGGSLRIFACHAEDETKSRTLRLRQLWQREIDAGLNTLAAYSYFAEQVKETKRKILAFLIQAKREGKKIIGYGAPGKGNTLLNYCGIRTDFLDFTVDKNPYKHYKFLPGTHIPIYPPEKMNDARPDYVFILPWNFKDEIMGQIAFIRDWNGKFVVPIPELTVYP